MFKSIANVVSPQQFASESPVIAETDVKRVFMVLHGYYGNLFFTKFATGAMVEVAGRVDAAGRPLVEDQGIANARKIWAHGLRGFDADTIKAALRQCQEKHTEFPPSLPQFIGLCADAAPREYFTAPPAVEMSAELKAKHAAEARAKRMAHLERARAALDGPVVQATALDALKQCIANAVGTAGGDEAAELLRLDHMLAPKAVTA